MNSLKNAHRRSYKHTYKEHANACKHTQNQKHIHKHIKHAHLQYARIPLHTKTHENYKYLLTYTSGTNTHTHTHTYIQICKNAETHEQSIHLSIHTNIHTYTYTHVCTQKTHTQNITHKHSTH